MLKVTTHWAKVSNLGVLYSSPRSPWSHGVAVCETNFRLYLNLNLVGYLLCSHDAVICEGRGLGIRPGLEV